MKNVFLLLTLAGGLIFLTNCEGQDDDGGPQSPEDNKKIIQDNGVELVNEFSALQQSTSVQSLTTLSLLLEEEDDEVAITGAGSLLKMNKSMLAFSSGKLSSIEFGRQSYKANAAAPGEDEFTSLQALFDENSGTYTWDPVEEDFAFEDNSEDEVIINFPSTEGGTENDVTVTISNYSGVTIPGNPLEEEYEGDLPTTLDVVMEVDGESVMTYSFDVNYNSEGIPESAETTLTLDTYALSVSLTNTNTKVGASVNFSNDSKLLIGVSTEVNGDFSDEAIENAEDDPTDVLNNGNFSMTLLNLKFTADVKAAALYTAIGGDDFEDSYYEYPGNADPMPDLEANAQLLEEALNDHADLKLTYVDTKSTAATVEWYTFVQTDELGDGYADHYIEIGARMVFEDGSKMDVEDFVETGFDELEDAIENLIDQIEDDLGQEFEDVEDDF